MTVIDAGDDFFERTVQTLYTEALLLSDETRAHLDGEGRTARDALDPIGRVQFACETLKATTRLLQVIAWLTACRDAEGERPELSTAGTSVSDILGRLPSPTRRLILAGIDLHERVGRLAAGTDAPIAATSPARTLIQRLERAW
jgi:regulator of CtrA degradation